MSRNNATCSDGIDWFSRITAYASLPSTDRLFPFDAAEPEERKLVGSHVVVGVADDMVWNDQMGAEGWTQQIFSQSPIKVEGGTTDKIDAPPSPSLAEILCFIRNHAISTQTKQHRKA